MVLAHLITFNRSHTHQTIYPQLLTNFSISNEDHSSFLSIHLLSVRSNNRLDTPLMTFYYRGKKVLELIKDYPSTMETGNNLYVKQNVIFLK